MTKKDIKDIIEIPEGVEVTVEPTKINVKGPNGDLERRFYSPAVKIKKEENKISFEVKKATKREKTIMKTTEAHIKNMIKGVTEKFEYKLKVCSGHFPMTASYDNGEFIVKNFLGESVPRKIKINGDVEITVKGNDITVSGPDKEKAGQAAARIESMTRMTNKDRRRFQDGIFIISKAGKEI